MGWRDLFRVVDGTRYWCPRCCEALVDAPDRLCDECWRKENPAAAFRATFPFGMLYEVAEKERRDG